MVTIEDLEVLIIITKKLSKSKSEAKSYFLSSESNTSIFIRTVYEKPISKITSKLNADCIKIALNLRG